MLVDLDIDHGPYSTSGPSPLSRSCWKDAVAEADESPRILTGASLLLSIPCRNVSSAFSHARSPSFSRAPEEQVSVNGTTQQHTEGKKIRQVDKDCHALKALYSSYIPLTPRLRPADLARSSYLCEMPCFDDAALMSTVTPQGIAVAEGDAATPE